MTENELSARLNSIQDQILDLYEKNSRDIQDQIELWNCIRKEYALFYGARKRGITRLGGQPVPSTAASQSTAKEAIQVSLLLQSLAKSKYGSEPWTLQETSKERLHAEPGLCFKKGGTPIDVTFDKDPENVARYTSWTFIYFQDSRDEWHKSVGSVDHSGLFYVDEQDNKVYYIDFLKEAMKFSSAAYWTVLNDGMLILPDDSVGSTSNADSTTEEGSSIATYSSELGRTSGTRWAQVTEDAANSPESARGPRATSTPRQRRGGGRGAGPPKAQARRGGRGGEPSQGASVGGHRLRSGGQQREPRNSSAYAVSLRRASQGPPEPESVGSSLEAVEGPSRSRLERLYKEARDPPFLGLRGSMNNLKCVRFRLKGQFSHLFDKITTTWRWTSSRGPERCGDGRLLILFKDEQQRNMFLSRVKLPDSVQLFVGSAIGI